MRQITDLELKNRLAVDNPWWDRAEPLRQYRQHPRRDAFNALARLANAPNRRSPVVLAGPAAVGKTVMMLQLVQDLLDAGTAPTGIVYVPLGEAVYAGVDLERLLRLSREFPGHDRSEPTHVLLDDLHNLPHGQQQAAAATGAGAGSRFVASLSALPPPAEGDDTAAQGFADIRVPPLSFGEFLRFSGRGGAAATEVAGLDAAFAAYLAHGGFPETAVSGPDPRLAADILDRLLLRDLPSLYGIGDPKEFKRLFCLLALNGGREISLEGLAGSTGIAKNTLRRYLDYLQAAFLIRRLNRLDQNAKPFRRQGFFKPYLAHPALHAALFGPAGVEEPAYSGLVETAVLAALPASTAPTSYARWPDGAVTFVTGGPPGPGAAVEVRWSDAPFERPREELAAYVGFCRRQPGLTRRIVCGRSARGSRHFLGMEIEFIPAADFCLAQPGTAGDESAPISSPEPWPDAGATH